MMKIEKIPIWPGLYLEAAPATLSAHFPEMDKGGCKTRDAIINLKPSIK
jgi:hypothetical protein